MLLLLVLHVPLSPNPQELNKPLSLALLRAHVVSRRLLGRLVGFPQRHGEEGRGAAGGQARCVLRPWTSYTGASLWMGIKQGRHPSDPSVGKRPFPVAHPPIKPIAAYAPRASYRLQGCEWSSRDQPPRAPAASPASPARPQRVPHLQTRPLGIRQRSLVAGRDCSRLRTLAKPSLSRIMEG